MSDTPKPSSYSIQRAAQAWCAEETSRTQMDVILGMEFARILDNEIALAYSRGEAEYHESFQRELATLRERLAAAERLNSDARPLIEEAHRECVANRELAKQAEQRALAAEALAEQNAKDAERLDSIEKHGLRILTDLGVDAFREGRTFNTVRAFFDAAIDARKP